MRQLTKDLPTFDTACYTAFPHLHALVLPRPELPKTCKKGLLRLKENLFLRVCLYSSDA